MDATLSERPGSLSQTIDRFSGINNADEAVRLAPEIVDHHYVYPLSSASNVEIDNTGALSSRSGYTSVKTGTDIHSMWADDICLYVDNGTLYKLNSDYTTVSLRTGLSKRRMSYAKFNNRVYYTNEEVIGFITTSDNALPAPGREFKEPLPAGKFIRYFKACLMVAKGKVLYISDPLCDYYDTRHGFRIFNTDITMVCPVDDGLYVSDRDGVWFLKGVSNEDFERDEAYPSPAIPYTDVVIGTQYVGMDKSGEVAMWTSENGICIGDDSGTVINLTEKRYNFTPTAEGAAFVRENDHLRFYVNTLF
jgi:hypothetical protein